LVSDTIFLELLGSRMHAAYIEGLKKAAPFGHRGRSDEFVDAIDAAFPVPLATLEYTVHEAALLGGADAPDEAYSRFQAMGALLQEAGQTWEKVEETMRKVPWRLDAYGFAAGDVPGRGPVDGSAEFSKVRGIRVDMETGHAYLLVERPRVGQAAVLTYDDLAAMLAVDDQRPVHVTLEPPRQGGGRTNYPRHPFQRAISGTPAVVPRDIEQSMLHVGLIVQQLASGSEVAARAPFPVRPCSTGLCRGLPPLARPRLEASRGTAHPDYSSNVPRWPTPSLWLGTLSTSTLEHPLWRSMQGSHCER